MGGFGSGRVETRPKAEGCLRLDIHRLKRAGRLEPGQAFQWTWTGTGGRSSSISVFTSEASLSLVFKTRRPGGDWEDVRQEIILERTACCFGGSRPWFACPHCGKRCAVLYGGTRFYCRSCHGLVYRSQAETPLNRSLRKSARLRAKLGGPPGTSHPLVKPKWMRWKTFDRIAAEIMDAEDTFWLGVGDRFGL